MRNSIFNRRLFLALGITTVVFYSCSKDDNGGTGSNVSTIKAANVINSSSDISTAEAVIYGYNDDYTVAQAPFKNNGFTLNLSATVPDEYLDAITDNTYVWEEASISDKTAKVASIDDINAYNSGGSYVGFFDCATVDLYNDNTDPANYVEAGWLYVDKNVTITGEFNNDSGNNAKINLTLKKGWNICFYTATATPMTIGQSTLSYISSMSSQKPSGITLEWYFEYKLN